MGLSSLTNKITIPSYSLVGFRYSPLSRWNRFDFFVTMIAVLDLIVSNFVDDVVRVQAYLQVWCSSFLGSTTCLGETIGANTVCSDVAHTHT